MEQRSFRTENGNLNLSLAGEEYDNLFKLVLIGDMGVGKTHLLERYKTGRLPAA